MADSKRTNKNQNEKIDCIFDSANSIVQGKGIDVYGIVYYALNNENGKVYVGQTTENLSTRKGHHCYCAKRNVYDNYFMRALRKHQGTDWEWNTLQVACCKEELDVLEEYWIWILNSMAPNGYNTKGGGSHGKHTKETCNAIGKALIDRKKPPRSEEHNRKISETMKGKKNGLGYKHTREELRKMSEVRKGRYMGAEHPKAKTVMCMETEKVYSTITEASRETNINCGNISSCCKGKRKTAGDFIWKYA